MKLTEEEQGEIAQALIDKNYYELVQRFFDSQAGIKKPNYTKFKTIELINLACTALKSFDCDIPVDVVDFIRDSALREIN